MGMNSLLIDASLMLSALPDRATYLDAARQTMGRLLPGDDVVWIHSNFASQSSSVAHGLRGGVDVQLSERMGHAADDPVIASNLAAPADLLPRRSSGFVSTNELAAHRRTRAPGGTCWPAATEGCGQHGAGLFGDAWVIRLHGTDFVDRKGISPSRCNHWQLWIACTNNARPPRPTHLDRATPLLPRNEASSRRGKSAYSRWSPQGRPPTRSAECGGSAQAPSANTCRTLPGHPDTLDLELRISHPGMRTSQD